MDAGKNSRESPSKIFMILRGIDSIRGIIAQEIERHTLK